LLYVDLPGTSKLKRRLSTLKKIATASKLTDALMAELRKQFRKRSYCPEAGIQC
jgi:hypothetical protein